MPALRLTALEFENYKAFRKLTRIELKPLTLVFGRNSSGKSALVRFPVLMEDSLRPSPFPGFRLRGKEINHGVTFLSLVHGVGPGLIKAGLYGTSEVGENWMLKVTVTPDSSPNRLAQRVLSWENTYGNRSTSPLTWRDGTQGGYDGLPPEFDQVRFEGLSPVFQGRTGDERPSQLPFSVSYNGPYRQVVEPVWSKKQLLTEELSWQSDGWAFLLLASEEGDRRLIQRVQTWLSKNFGWNVRIRMLPGAEGVADGFCVLLSRQNSSLWQNLADLGTGMQQVLPVIVQAAAAALGQLDTSIVVCEEPESHLHPAAQAMLADLYLEAADTDGCPPLLIETHSEAILLRVRRQIAEKSRLADKVGLIFVEDGEFASEARSLTLENDGWVPDWPLGIFEEDAAERRAIGRALEKRQEESLS